MLCKSFFCSCVLHEMLMALVWSVKGFVKLQGILRTFLKKSQFKVPLQNQKILILTSSYFSCPLSSVAWNPAMSVKGGFISGGILNLVTLPSKGAKSFPLTENSNFPPSSINNLLKFSAQGRDLAYFVGNGSKVKIPSEIKPPLTGQKRGILSEIKVFSK